MRVDTGPVVGRLALSVTHQGFYLVGLHGHTARDQLAARLGDDGIVLDADADVVELLGHAGRRAHVDARLDGGAHSRARSEEHTSELQSPCNLVCRLLLEKKKKINLECSL